LKIECASSQKEVFLFIDNLEADMSNFVKEIAKSAWENSSVGRSFSKKRCLYCMHMWRIEKRPEEDKPPIFPVDYEKNCPVCGCRLERC